MGKLLDSTMKIIGFSKLIKIPGKSHFDQLTKPEVALMIEAFLGDGNEHFDPLAFNDFLHCDLKEEELERIQQALKKHAFLPAQGDKWPLINHAYLRKMIGELRNAGIGSDLPS